MRKVGFVKGCELVLSHSYKPLFTTRLLLRSCIISTERINRTKVTMAAVDGELKWSALHVRNTFLEYFKKNGHTFGKHFWGLFVQKTQIIYSAIIFGCAAVRSNSTVRYVGVPTHFLQIDMAIRSEACQGL